MRKRHNWRQHKKLTQKVGVVRKIKVRVPATLTSVGAGLHSLGMALSIHTRVALQERSDTELSVSITGDETDNIPATVDNLALRAAIRVFQHSEEAPLGLHVEVHNAIPFGMGMGENIAMVVGGLVAAHNLIETDLTRDDLVNVAMSFGLPYEGIISAMLGSMGICSSTPNEPFTLAYDAIDLPPTRAIIVIPQLEKFDAQAIRFPEVIKLNNAIRNMRQTLLMTEALRHGNYKLLKRTLAYQLFASKYAEQIPHYNEVQQAALDAGAAGITLAGDGQVLLAFAEEDPFAAAEAMVERFNTAGIETRHWVLPIDRQGVVISALRDAEMNEDDEGIIAHPTNPLKAKKTPETGDS